MLIDEIKKSNFEALKNKDSIARAVLSVVYSEYLNRSIEAKFNNVTLTDLDTISILQKTIKEIEESKINYLKVNNNLKVSEMERQISILKKFLPIMLSEAEIIEEINKLSDKSIGSIMKHFKVNFAGKCDMQLVNKVFKQLQN